MWHRTALSAAFVLVGGLALAGCASSGSAPGSFDQTVTLRVVNHSGSRVSVSAIWARGQPVYAGEVQNRRERSFTLSYVRAANLQALVEFADGGRATSTPISVDPNGIVELRVGVDRIPMLRPAEP